FLENQPIPIQVVLPIGALFVTGTLHYRKTGDLVYESDDLAAGPVHGQQIAYIPREVVGPQGVDYWVEARTITRELTYPAADASNSPARIRVRAERLTEPVNHPGRVYRMLSVPLDLGPGFAGGIDAILTDQFGVYSTINWRCYHFDPDSA